MLTDYFSIVQLILETGMAQLILETGTAQLIFRFENLKCRKC